MAHQIPILTSQGSKKYLVIWERIANSGMYIVYAESPKDAMFKVGYSTAYCRITTIRIYKNEQPIQIGERN